MNHAASNSGCGLHVLRKSPTGYHACPTGSAWPIVLQKRLPRKPPIQAPLGVHPQVYWRVLKKRLIEEGNETVTNCNALKMMAADGKSRLTDVADTEQVLRLVQSIPSPASVAQLEISLK